MKYLHTMIRVSDPDATIRFFELLGLRELRRMDNQEKLRRLSVEKAGEIRILCAHDVVEFEAAAAGRLL